MKRRTAWIVGVTVLTLVVLFMILGNAGFGEQEYRSFQSPEGGYRVVVSRQSRFSSMMPGQSGDAPGTVRLYSRDG